MKTKAAIRVRPFTWQSPVGASGEALCEILPAFRCIASAKGGRKPLQWQPSLAMGGGVEQVAGCPLSRKHCGQKPPDLLYSQAPPKLHSLSHLRCAMGNFVH